MPYKYVAYTEDRRVVEGTIDVSTEGLAKEQLWQSGYRILSLKATRPVFNIHRSLPTLFGAKPRDVIAFSRQLATLVDRGINAFSALQVLRGQIRNPAFKETVTTMIQDLQEGSSFADAISRHPQAFPSIYSRMVRVGERTGNLQIVLRQVAEYIETEKAALKRVRKAMVYPALILLVACGVVAILVTFTLPPLLEMFNEFEAQLPWVTKVLISIVGFVTGHWFYIALVVIGAVVLAVWLAKTSTGRERFDRLLLRMPLIGPIVTQREMAHLSRTMSISLDAGLPMIEIMDLAVQSTSNTVIRKALEDIRTQILEGRGLFQSMAPNELFPPLLVQMVKIGEEVGTLTKDLTTVADLYEQEVDERVDLLLSMLQPLSILILGLIVAFIAVSVIVPIYSIMGSI